jgi:deoxyribonuclease-4
VSAHLEPPRLGAHLSIAGGLPRAVELGAELGVTALQVFVKSARQWDARALEPAEVAAFRRALAGRDLARHTLAHAGYLINLASPEAAARERSIRALGSELARCRRLGIPYLVVHPGSHMGRGEAEGLGRVVRAIDRLLAPRRGGARPYEGVTLLLETTAGQGSALGHRFEHLARILDESRARDRLGICFDTCHVHAAGYDLHDDASCGAVFDELDRRVGLERLRAFHLNDSKARAGSRLDRHEHIGRGRIGLAAFRRIVNDPRFRDLPMVLETPKGEGTLLDRRNLRLLRSLVEPPLARPRTRR